MRRLRSRQLVPLVTERVPPVPGVALDWQVELEEQVWQQEQNRRRRQQEQVRLLEQALASEDTDQCWQVPLSIS